MWTIGFADRLRFPRFRPSVVITIYPADQDPLWWKYLKWPDDFVKVENIPL
jgi:hypothetical protein